VKIEKIFSSIAQPLMLKLSTYPKGAPGAAIPISITENLSEVTPRLIFKKGDNLFQDLSCMTIFRAFNYLWKHDRAIFQNERDVPFIHTYDIFPTGEKRGFLEAVPSVVSFKDFDWKKWKEIKDAEKSLKLINSAAGAYIGGFVVGVRDRHWDNILVQNDEILFHIDFGFLLGTQPPIDAPKFSISKSMRDTLGEVGLWNPFVEKCVKCIQVLRKNSEHVVNLTKLVLKQAGWDPLAVDKYIRSTEALMMEYSDEKCESIIVELLSSSPNSWQNLFKQFSHRRIDPVFYGLLERHFPPAEIAMKVVEYKDSKKQKKMKESEKQEDAKASKRFLKIT